MWDKDKVRIKDIADELGVSTATVSNVLHGKTKKISDRTVKAVEQKLEECGYIPNMAATLLARNNSRIIGVVVNDHPKYEGHTFEDSFISAAIDHLYDVIESRSYFMMLKKAKRITEIVRFSSMWNMDGVVIIGFCRDEYQDLRDRIRVPFVIYDGFPDEQDRFGNVVIDDFDGGRQAGAYLRDMGHKRVRCISDNKICMYLLRYNGLCAGLQREAVFMKIPMAFSERELFYTERLDQIKSFTAVFAVSDHYALELMRFLQRNNVNIPGDISVIGFDGSSDGQNAVPRLTSIKQDHKRRAEAAIDLLIEIIGGTADHTTISIPVTLSVGESVHKIGTFSDQL